MEGTAMDKMFPNKAGERVEKDSTFCDHFTPSFCKKKHSLTFDFLLRELILGYSWQNY